MRTPRPFQLEQFTSVRDAFRAGKRGVIVEAPTGTGKAVSIALISKMTQEKGGRVLINVNRDILVSQLIEELRAVDVFAQREQAGERANLTAGVVVASIQSLVGDRLKRWPREHFKLCITDEVHGSAAKSFKAVLDHFESAYHCGFTATPERHDKRGLWKGYTDIVFSYSLKQAIDDGWLCGFNFIELECPVTIDIKIAKQAIIGENEEVFDSRKYLPRLADCAVAESQGKKGLFFLPNCRVSKEFATMLQERGLNAQHIDSSYMPASETTRLLEWFAKEKHAVLCNSDLLSVGYNQPDVDCIGLFRPIASTPLYKQRLGRGTRPIAPVDLFSTPEARREAIASSAKPYTTVLNVFWENGSHDLAQPSCLITDSKEEQEELNKARNGKPVNLEEMENGLRAMRNTAEEMRKYAEKVANSQEKKKRGALFIADILRSKNPAHKPASPQFVRYIRNKYKVEIPSGEYTAYQMMRIKDRAEKHMKKAA